MVEKRGQNDVFFRRFSEKTPKRPKKRPEKTPKKCVKTRFSAKRSIENRRKRNFFALNISVLYKKVKKSASEVNNRIGKTLFLRSQLRGKRGDPLGRGDGDWDSSLKEWKDVANTQGFF